MTIADLSRDGNVPDESAAFTRRVITGARTGRRSHRREVGIGSNEQEAFEAF